MKRDYTEEAASKIAREQKLEAPMEFVEEYERLPVYARGGTRNKDALAILESSEERTAGQWGKYDLRTLDRAKAAMMPLRKMLGKKEVRVEGQYLWVRRPKDLNMPGTKE
jgi:hypothetical protein